jgi:predicted ATP-dependent protease
VQAIGGVNEKIEGFFDICRQRGLTGKQGVLIPSSNVKHLMLRSDVIQAVEEGMFQIYPVEHVDQGIELLTGIPAGEMDADGNYPSESINGRVAAHLAALAEKARELNRPAKEQE